MVLSPFRMAIQAPSQIHSNPVRLTGRTSTITILSGLLLHLQNYMSGETSIKRAEDQKGYDNTLLIFRRYLFQDNSGLSTVKTLLLKKSKA